MISFFDYGVPDHLRSGISCAVLFFVGVLICQGSSECFASPGIDDAAAMEYVPAPSSSSHSSLRLSAVQKPNPARHPDFQVPVKLRGRVNFWIDIFTVYGKQQSVFHHRDFPQAVFTVLDFSSEAQRMNDVQLERYKKERLKVQTRQIETILLALGRGEKPNTQLERNIADAMLLVPGGASKYAVAVKEELVRSQTGIREKYAEAIKRSNRYMHFIEKIFVQDFGLPIELTRLPFIESSFDYQAYSSVGAAGIWQFMRSTGRIYMTINNLIDERRDVFAATRAAARYLFSAYKSLGNWPLAITSYNHGVGGVYKKVRAAASRDLATIIEHPRERYFGFASSNFYPEFLAALEVYDNRKHYFPEVIEDAPMHVKEVRLSQAVSVAQVLKKYPEINLEQLKAANYAVDSVIWNGRYKLPAGYVLKVPAGLAIDSVALRMDDEQSVAAVPAASSVYGGMTYKVRPGDTVSSIARRYNASVAEILELNGMHTPILRVGQVIRVKEPSSSAPTVSKLISTENEQSSSTKTYRVRSGDSLWSIARSQGTSVEQLKKANHLKRGIIKPGQNLVIP